MLARTALIVLLAAAGAAAQRPNIVLFLVDDLGWQDSSVAFGPERTKLNDHFRTPALERLAQDGVVFTNAYACAVCSPTRTSWMTGQNAARHGVTNWTLLPDRDQSGQTATLRSPSAWPRQGLQPGKATVPRLLQRAGYRTIHAGKAHWGARGTAGEDPHALGFDVNIAGHCAGAPGSYTGLDGFGRGRAPWAVPGLEAWHGLPVHLTDVLTGAANQAVAAAVEAGQPFFLYLAHYAVHTPIQEHAPYATAYRERGVDEREARYASMVEGVDRSLASLIAQLERLGVAEETLVLYASDNGGLSAHGRGTTANGTGKDTHNAPLRAGKASAYEGGTRIPQVIGWAASSPEHPVQKAFALARGSRVDVPTICEDWFATILRWAGVEAAVEHTTDGVDLTPLLSGTAAAATPRPLLFHYPHVWGPQGDGYGPHSAVRLGDLKAVFFYETRRWELYDLAVDLGERHDLAAERRDDLRRLAAVMVELLDARGAHYPVEKATGAVRRPTLP